MIAKVLYSAAVLSFFFIYCATDCNATHSIDIAILSVLSIHHIRGL